MLAFYDFEKERAALRLARKVVEDHIKQIERDFVKSHCPVQVGQVIENHRFRLLIRHIKPESPAYWRAYGTVLKKDGKIDERYSKDGRNVCIAFPSNYETNERCNVRVVVE